MNKELLKEKLKTLSVLFVDDERLVIDTMKDILPMLFKETYFAEDGYKGLEEYKKYLPDLVITDLSMPILDGLSMIKYIKEINKDAKIICVSGHNEEQNIKDCKSYNCGYIVKPISSRSLFNEISEVLTTINQTK